MLRLITEKLQTRYQRESAHMTELAKKRPEFRNINALSDLPSYRLPAGCPSCTASAVC